MGGLNNAGKGTLSTDIEDCGPESRGYQSYFYL